MICNDFIKIPVKFEVYWIIYIYTHLTIILQYTVIQAGTDYVLKQVIMFLLKLHNLKQFFVDSNATYYSWE